MRSRACSRLFHPGTRTGFKSFLVATELLHHRAGTKALWSLTRRELHHALHEHSDDCPRRHQHKPAIRSPLGIEERGDFRLLKRIRPQVEEHGKSQGYQRVLPGVDSLRALHREMDLPFIVAKRHKFAVVAPVEETGARTFYRLALEMRNEAVAGEMELARLLPGGISLLALFDDVRFTGRCQQRGKHVLVREDLIGDRTRLDHTRPADRAGHAPAAIPVRILLAAKRSAPAVGPAQFFGAVVGRVHHDGVVGNTQLVELIEELSYVTE